MNRNLPVKFSTAGKCLYLSVGTYMKQSSDTEGYGVTPLRRSLAHSAPLLEKAATAISFQQSRDRIHTFCLDFSLSPTTGKLVSLGQQFNFPALVSTAQGGWWEQDTLLGLWAELNELKMSSQLCLEHNEHTAHVLLVSLVGSECGMWVCMISWCRWGWNKMMYIKRLVSYLAKK